MADKERRERSPAIRLLFVCLVGLTLVVPLLLVYALIHDRQGQAGIAQEAISAGWGGPQVLSGPILVVPFRTTQTQTDTSSGKPVTSVVDVEKLVYLSPVENRVKTGIVPEARAKSIYRSVVYSATVAGHARFALPADLQRFGVTRERLMWDRAELRVGVSDARGLVAGATLAAQGGALPVQPGRGPASSGGQGYFAFVDWDGQGDLAVDYGFSVRGSRALALVPRGGSTTWDVSSSWTDPDFAGGFLPERRSVSAQGFTANYRIDKLALGQPPLGFEDVGAPAPQNTFGFSEAMSDTSVLAKSSAVDPAAGGASEVVAGNAQMVAVGLIEPVDLYSKVNRAVKYGFLFIGFTFLTFFLFDVVGGARVAGPEYLLAGAGLVLFFVLLLAFAEVVGFGAAYLMASAAVIGLLAAYSAAVLKSRRRGAFVGAMLVGLYALLFVLLSLEAWSLLIGSAILFAALAGVMYATRNVEWGGGTSPGS